MKDLKRALQTSCKKVITWGWRIEPNYFLNPEHLACCPLGAVIIASCGSTEAFEKTYPACKSSVTEKLNELLSIDEHWRFAFWQGFDDQEVRLAIDPDAYALGKEMRVEFFEQKLRNNEKENNVG
jgi:hypothetical protein